ncbi:MAG: GNAT family N-acetyltransferase [Clostridium sp.]|nr:GNAT family N-acetyltransferase [Clostridium sp.]
MEELLNCLEKNEKDGIIYHRKGIASKLFNEVISILKENGVDSIRLNSSPYAVPFYHSIGFKDLGVQQEFQGILFTPMELILA